MHISQEEMNRRLNSSKNLVNKLKDIPSVDKPAVVHAPMHKYTPPADPGVKILGATLVAQGEKSKDVQQMLGLSAGQIQSAKNAPQVVDTMERVRNLALDKLLIAMGLMTQEKFENAKLEELAKAASALSRVAGNLQSKEVTNNVQFIVHAPQTKSLSNYPTIDV